MKSLILVLSFVGLQFLQKPDWELKSSQFLFQPTSLNFYDFNLRAVNSDLLWLRFLIDDHMSTQYRDDKSWHFHLLDTLTNLIPQVPRRIYRVGGEILSVLVDDKIGAKEFFDKGLKIYPKYWQLSYSAAYHYMEEIKDFNRAAELLEQSVENGANDWVMSLAAKLYSEAGRLEYAIKSLEDYLKYTPNSEARDHIEARLKNLKNKALTIAN